MAELVGFTLGAVSLYVKLFDGSRRTLETALSALEKESVGSSDSSDNQRNSTWTTTVLGWLLPSFQPQVEAIDRLLTKTTNEPFIRFRDSYCLGCNMTLIAGAIMAQVALTSMVLPVLSQIHWIVRATFVLRLVAGVASVYFAVLSQKIVGSLLSPGNLRDWLSIPIEHKVPLLMRDLENHTQLRNIKRMREESSSRLEPKMPEGLENIQARGLVMSLVPRKTSVSAVHVLGSSSILLGISLSTFLLAMGLYLLFVWTKNLDPLATQYDSRNVVIFFIVAVVLMLLFFAIPLGIKRNEVVKKELYNNVLQRLYYVRRTAPANSESVNFRQENSKGQDTLALSVSFQRLSEAIVKAIEAQQVFLKASEDLATAVDPEKRTRLVPERET